jgi:hypothetical protein
MSSPLFCFSSFFKYFKMHFALAFDANFNYVHTMRVMHFVNYTWFRSFFWRLIIFVCIVCVNIKIGFYFNTWCGVNLLLSLEAIW